jgi:DNA-binding NarL/FixJ family response regulator
MRRKRSPAPRSPKRRILIVDGHPLVRRGLTDLIDNEPDLIVCAEAATQRAGLERIASNPPDLVITDLFLGEDDGLSLLKEIRSLHADLPLLVFTLHDAAAYTRRAFEAGASGYVSKAEPSEALLVAIRRLLDGGKPASPKIDFESPLA